jgi:hypothetical protein
MNGAARERRAVESGEWTGNTSATVKVETQFDFLLSATLREKGEQVSM